MPGYHHLGTGDHPAHTMPMRGFRPRLLMTWGLLASVYFVAGKLGLLVATAQLNVALVWAPTGIALAAVLLMGYRVWPGIALGAFLVNAPSAPLGVALVAAVGNTLEAVVGVSLLRHLAFDRSLN